MRVLSVLLLTVALASASGCFGKDDEPPTTTTPAPTGGTTTTPTGPTSTTPTTPTANATPPTPAKPAPKELCAVSEDFSDNQPPLPPATGPATDTADCGSVTAGYTKLQLIGNFTAGTPPVAGPGITVKVLDAAGGTAATCTGPGAGAAAALACDNSGTAAAGAYTLLFEGAGGVGFTGSVMIT